MDITIITPPTSPLLSHLLIELDEPHDSNDPGWQQGPGHAQGEYDGWDQGGEAVADVDEEAPRGLVRVTAAHKVKQGLYRARGS